MTDMTTVTRLEVIDHRKHLPAVLAGRVYVAYDVAVELSYQDAGRTLKVYVGDRAPEKAA